MNKKDLVKVIEKYYLGGLTEQVKFKIKDNQLTINFATALKDCIGELSAPMDMEDVELGIYDTTQLYKLVNITNDPIQLTVEKAGETALRLEIKDNQYDLSYNLGDLGLISEGKLQNSMPPPSIKLTLDTEFINRFIKAHNALEKVETFTIKSEIDKTKSKNLKFTIGLNERYANKITFSQPVETYSELEKFTYRVSNFREILSNSKNSECEMIVYSMGIVSLITKEDDINVQYYLVPNKNI